MFKVKNKDIRMTSMTIALTTLLLNLRKICAITSKGVLKTQTSKLELFTNIVDSR